MSILNEAHTAIYGDREKTYGHPAKNFNTIATMWEAHLFSRGLLSEDGEGLQPEDVACMMMLLKIARLSNDLEHHDSLVDVCGYAALIDRIHNEPETGEYFSTGSTQVSTFVVAPREDEQSLQLRNT